jgi:putative hydrolase of the HAD superfamily
MIDQKIIKNVILDLGGVLVNIDPESTYTAFKRIFLPEVMEQFNWEELPEIVNEMETGKISNDEFKSRMLELCKSGVTPSEMIDAWCAMIHDFPAKRVGMVKKLAENFNVYLLSNTNSYHIKFFEKEFKYRYHANLHDLFTKVYYSSVIGFRKPNAEAFQFVLNDANLLASETVMIDDRQDNCDAAIALGMHALKVPENSGLERVFCQLVNGH